jgi:hypothetical protein
MAGKALHLLMLISFVMFCVKTNAQNNSDEKQRQIEKIIESVAESDDGEGDSPQVLDDLEKFSERPLNINTATAEEFEQLHLLDLNQINEILNYRKNYGYFLSDYELHTLKTLTPGIIKALEPFISFVQPDSAKKGRRVRQELLMRAKTTLPIAKGYTSVSENKTAAYPGMPLSLYTRYHFEIANKLELGFITDHDAGEEFFKGSNRRGFDYYSGFLSWQSKSFVQQIIVGDYYLKFGQGLNYWSGSGIGKSSNVINIIKAGGRIRPYTSTDENQYFRGIAAMVGKGSLKTTLFYSDKKRDANLTLDKASGDTVFTSLKTGGYHRTNSELDDEKALREQDFGIYSEWQNNNFSLGGLFSHQQFNLNMITGTAAYKAKSFSGNENTNMGVDYRLIFNKIQLFGEAAISMNQKTAFIQGMIWHVHPQLNLSFYYRYFDPGFHSFYGNPLSEGTEGRNERGFYTGIEVYPFSRVKIFGYADFYHFPWLTYSTIAPSSGKDFMAQIEFSPSQRLFFYLKGKFEIKPQKYTKETNDPFDFNESVNKMRIHFEWRLSDCFMLKNRFEWVNYSFYQTKEDGYLGYQDIDFTVISKLNLIMRYAIFNTDGYNSRVYCYENDLLYSFSFPEFHGKGQRLFVNLRWQPLKNFTFYFKAGHTIHSGEKSWGTGNDLTMGNNRTELRTELYFKF